MEKQSQKADTNYVGVDVSKAGLDVSPDGKGTHSIANNANGHAQLVAMLRGIANARVVCEATGGYEASMVAALMQAGIEVCVVNPQRVRAFAKANGWQAKTDKLDAKLLRQFGVSIAPRVEHPCSQSARDLREMLEYRRAISDQLVAMTNRCELAGKILRAHLEKTIAMLKVSLSEIDALIENHISGDAGLSAKRDRMRELCGVGPVLAATLLAYVPEIGEVPPEQLSSLVGVAPYACDSGPHKGKRFIRGGRTVVRHVLFMGAVAAARHNVVLKRFYEGLIARGKAKKVAIVAVMRKMLHVISRLLSDTNFVLVR
jgi:transposase